MSQDLLSDGRAVLLFVSIYTIAKILGTAFRLRVVRAREAPGDVEEDTEGRGNKNYTFGLCQSPESWLRRVEWGSRWEREFAKVCGRGVQLQLHPSLLLLTFNEIGNNKFVFPGVMVYISMLPFHFTLKSFQKKKFFFMGRERGVWDSGPVFKSY